MAKCRNRIVIAMIIVIFLMTACKGNNKEKKESQQEEKDVVVAVDSSKDNKNEKDMGTSSIKEQKYKNYILYSTIDEEVNKLWILNKATGEIKLAFDEKVDEHVFQVLGKDNYFISNNRLFRLDGDDYSTELVYTFEDEASFFSVQYPYIIYNVDYGLYLYNAETNTVEGLNTDIGYAKAEWDESSIYLLGQSKEGKNKLLQYNINSGKMNDIESDLLNYYFISLYRSEQNKIYISARYGDGELGKIDNNDIVKVQRVETNDKKIADIAIADNRIYYMYDDNTYTMNDFMSYKITVDDHIYCLTNEGNILSVSKEDYSVLEILNWEKNIPSSTTNQEEILTLKDDNIYRDKKILVDNEMSEGGIERTYYSNHMIKKPSDIEDYFIIKNGATYAYEESKVIKGKIGEEFDEYDYSNKLIAYTTLDKNSLIILDNLGSVLDKINDSVYNIQVIEDQVYYVKTDKQVYGLYMYTQGKETLLAKSVISKYCVTDKYVYYNDAINNNSFRVEKGDKSVNKINDKMDIMIANDSTVYYTNDRNLLYKYEDNAVDCELVLIIPSWNISYLFFHDNYIYAGKEDEIYTAVYKISTEPYIPNDLVYEDDEVALIPIVLSCYEQCPTKTYVYSKKIKKVIGSIPQFYNYNDSIQMDDAVLFSCDTDKPSIVKYDIANKSIELVLESPTEGEGLGSAYKIWISSDKGYLITNQFIDYQKKGILITDIETKKEVYNKQTGELLGVSNNRIYYLDNNRLSYMDLNNLEGEELLDLSQYNQIGDDIYSRDVMSVGDYILLDDISRHLFLCLNTVDNTVDVIDDNYRNYYDNTDEDIYYTNQSGDLMKFSISDSSKTVILESNHFKVFYGIVELNGREAIIYGTNSGGLAQLELETNYHQDIRSEKVSMVNIEGGYAINRLVDQHGNDSVNVLCINDLDNHHSKNIVIDEQDVNDMSYMYYDVTPDYIQVTINMKDDSLRIIKYTYDGNEIGRKVYR